MIRNNYPMFEIGIDCFFIAHNMLTRHKYDIRYSFDVKNLYFLDKLDFRELEKSRKKEEILELGVKNTINSFFSHTFVNDFSKLIWSYFVIVDTLVFQ